MGFGLAARGEFWVLGAGCGLGRGASQSTSHTSITRLVGNARCDSTMSLCAISFKKRLWSARSISESRYCQIGCTDSSAGHSGVDETNRADLIILITTTLLSASALAGQSDDQGFDCCQRPTHGAHSFCRRGTHIQPRLKIQSPWRSPACSLYIMLASLAPGDDIHILSTSARRSGSSTV